MTGVGKRFIALLLGAAAAAIGPSFAGPGDPATDYYARVIDEAEKDLERYETEFVAEEAYFRELAEFGPLSLIAIAAQDAIANCDLEAARARKRDLERILQAATEARRVVKGVLNLTGTTELEYAIRSYWSDVDNEFRDADPEDHLETMWRDATSSPPGPDSLQVALDALNMIYENIDAELAAREAFSEERRAQLRHMYELLRALYDARTNLSELLARYDELIATLERLIAAIDAGFDEHACWKCVDGEGEQAGTDTGTGTGTDTGPPPERGHIFVGPADSPPGLGDGPDVATADPPGGRIRLPDGTEIDVPEPPADAPRGHPSGEDGPKVPPDGRDVLTNPEVPDALKSP